MSPSASPALARVGAAIVAAAVLAVPATASATKKPSPVGAWQTQVFFSKNPTPAGTHETLGQAFLPGGVVAQSIGGLSTGYGAWKPGKKPRTFLFTAVENMVTDGFVFTGYVQVRQKGTLSKNGKTFKSSGTGQAYSPTGVPQGPPASTSVLGKRVSVDFK